MVDQKRKNRITRITRVGTMLGVASILALASMSNAMAKTGERTAKSGWKQYVNYKGADPKGQATTAAKDEAKRSLESTCITKGGVKKKTLKPLEYSYKNSIKKTGEYKVRATYTFECNKNK